MAYNRILGNLNQTPQSKQAHPSQVANNAGGYSFTIDKWLQLERWLILGSEAGTYYVQAKDLTIENLDVVKTCLKENGPRVVDAIRAVSLAGRAIKNDPAILALAAAVAYGDAETKMLARGIIADVCRTGTHILHFASYADKLRGWGRGLRSTIKTWYEDLCRRDVNSLAYQMVKYQSRDGWSHHDLIRLAHPGSNDPLCSALYDWALHGAKPEKEYPKIVRAFEDAKSADAAGIAVMINTYGLSREMIPTDKLNTKEVAYQLGINMPLGALIRNLGNLSKAGLLNPGTQVFARTLDTLSDVLAMKKARVHPIALLIALKTYASGKGLRGHGEWPVIPQVVDALNEAFYLSFEAVQPLGKKLLIALDCSDSMRSEVTGTLGFSAAEAAAAMALVTASTEKAYTMMAFGTVIHPWTISPRSRLDDVMRSVPRGGGTDVSAPINKATSDRLNVDAIVIYTDSETWHGHNHPFQAMADYRRLVNAKAKLIIVATTATALTVGAPDDPLTLNICGFDSSVPEVIRTFLAD